jgi:hypothetical protein
MGKFHFGTPSSTVKVKDHLHTPQSPQQKRLQDWGTINHEKGAESFMPDNQK